MGDTHKLVVGDRGRLVIPADVRARAGIEEGTVLMLFENEDGFALLTREQLRLRVRDDLAGADLVSALLSDRRADAVREDRESERMPRGDGAAA